MLRRFFLLAVVTPILISCAAGGSASPGLNDEPLVFYPELPQPEEQALTFEPHVNFSKDVALPMGQIVDSQYPTHRDLLKPRAVVPSTNRIDSCHDDLHGKVTFAERISWAVAKKMKMSVPRIGYVASLFGIQSTNESSYLMTSLLSHPLCLVSPDSLAKTFQGKNIPANSVINKVNLFVTKMNSYRKLAYDGAEEGYFKAQRLWSKFLMCLSYMESLTSADGSKSLETAKKYLPKSVPKASGVSFFEDPRMTGQGYLNLGLYQFGSYSSGDTQSCIREWNDLFPQCPINRSAPVNEMLLISSSSHQTFNAFCAAAKVTGMFGVQVNTQNPLNTFPTNILPDGSLKPGAERCVAFTMNVKTSYNHFAPFQNGDGFTLGSIMSCALTGEY